MEKPARQEYPTGQQMDEFWESWKKDGKAGIMELLKQRRREREQEKEDSTQTGGPAPE